MSSVALTPALTTTVDTNPTTTSTKKIKKRCSGWCWPLLVYLGLVFINLLSIFLFRGIDIISLIFGILLNIFFAGILYLLCYHCHKKWAAFLLFLPIIIFLILLIIAFSLGIITFISL